MIINSPWKVFETFEQKPNQKEPIVHFSTVLEMYKASFEKKLSLSFINLKWDRIITTDYTIELAKENEPTQLITFKSWICSKFTENQLLITMLWEQIKVKDLTPWLKIARFGKQWFIYDEVQKLEKPIVDYYENQKYIIKSNKDGWFILGYDDLLLG